MKDAIKKVITSLAPALLMMAWCTYYFAQVSQQSADSQRLIRPIYYVLCVLFVVMLINAIRQARAEASAKSEAQSEKKAVKDAKYYKELKIMVIFVVGTGLYLLALPRLGFIISTPIFLFAAFLYLKSDKKTAVILAVLLTAFAYIVFKMLLNVPLPAGILSF